MGEVAIWDGYPDGRGDQMGGMSRWKGWLNGWGFQTGGGPNRGSGQVREFGSYVAPSILQSHQLLFASEYRIFFLQNTKYFAYKTAARWLTRPENGTDRPHKGRVA
jgi:hypothetical protein